MRSEISIPGLIGMGITFPPSNRPSPGTRIFYPAHHSNIQGSTAANSIPLLLCFLVFILLLPLYEGLGEELGNAGSKDSFSFEEELKPVYYTARNIW